MSDEKCVRCGEIEDDRRTLWMACFYAMEELGLPFEKEVLFRAETQDLEMAKPPITFESKSSKDKLVLESGTVRSSGELYPQQLYTLRVCKECRADWMTAIQAWFKMPPAPREGSGTGVWIRKNGATVEATQEEVGRMLHGRQP
jgi:hypothetical protein